MLAQLARAAVSGFAPAGPEFRRGREAVAFAGRPSVLIAARLCVREHDFSLHAATHAGAQDLKTWPRCDDRVRRSGAEKGLASECDGTISTFMPARRHSASVTTPAQPGLRLRAEGDRYSTLLKERERLLRSIDTKKSKLERA
ncbi:MAG: hypothetical protein ABI488_12745, partial [Polyangiaceae bacterium]